MQGKRRPLIAIFVDYIGLLAPEKESGNRVQDISTITRGLKSMAMEMHVPVIAASQLSRAAAGDVMPALHNLRESGSIEQDANTVLFLHDPGTTTAEESAKGVYRRQLLLRKNRHGRSEADYDLFFAPGVNRFVMWEAGHGETR